MLIQVVSLECVGFFLWYFGVWWEGITTEQWGGRRASELELSYVCCGKKKKKKNQFSCFETVSLDHLATSFMFFHMLFNVVKNVWRGKKSIKKSKATKNM